MRHCGIIRWEEILHIGWLKHVETLFLGCLPPIKPPIKAPFSTGRNRWLHSNHRIIVTLPMAFRGASRNTSPSASPGQPTPSGRSTAELMLGRMAIHRMGGVILVPPRYGMNPIKYGDVYTGIIRYTYIYICVCTCIYCIYIYVMDIYHDISPIHIRTAVKM